MRIRGADQVPGIDFAKCGGLIPGVVQHFVTGEALMLGYFDAEAVRRCLETGELWLYSRSRREHWRKGATSGNTQRVLEVHADCDHDALLLRVLPRGPTCHTGERSCFGAPPALMALGDVITQRAASGSETSYTVTLLRDENLRLKKLGEEAVELAVACQAQDAARATEEAADLIYHTLVACAATGVTVEHVLQRLAERAGPFPA